MEGAGFIRAHSEKVELKYNIFADDIPNAEGQEDGEEGGKEGYADPAEGADDDDD